MGANVRLARLLGLIDHATSAQTRALAVERILGILREEQVSQNRRAGSSKNATSDPPLRQLVLDRILQYLRSPSWDIRVTGAELLGEIIMMQPDHEVKSYFESSHSTPQMITLDELQLNRVISNGRPLLSENILQSRKNRAARSQMASLENVLDAQRREMLEHVGLVPDSKFLQGVEAQAAQQAIGKSIEDSVFTAMDPTSSEKSDADGVGNEASTKKMSGGIKVDTSLTPTSHATEILCTMSVRQSKNLKRQRGKDSDMADLKRRKMGLALMSAHEKDDKHIDVCFVLQELRHSILHPTWEVRHGASLGIKSVISHGVENCMINRLCEIGFLDDCLTRAICVLALDHFSDYARDQIVSPAQEIAAQFIGTAVRHLMKMAPESCSSLVMHIESLIERAPAWQSRFGGVLALKYAGVAVVVESTRDFRFNILERIIGLVVKSLVDVDDDVRSTAATAVGAIIVAARTSTGRADSRSVLDVNTKMLLHKSLWDALDRSDELSASAVSILEALKQMASFTVLHPPSATALRSFLRFLLHGLSQVRSSATSILKNIFDENAIQPFQEVHCNFMKDLLQLLFESCSLEESSAMLVTRFTKSPASGQPIENDDSYLPPCLGLWHTVVDKCSPDILASLLESSEPNKDCLFDKWLNIITTQDGRCPDTESHISRSMIDSWLKDENKDECKKKDEPSIIVERQEYQKRVRQLIIATLRARLDRPYTFLARSSAAQMIGILLSRVSQISEAVFSTLLDRMLFKILQTMNRVIRAESSLNASIDARSSEPYSASAIISVSCILAHMPMHAFDNLNKSDSTKKLEIAVFGLVQSILCRAWSGPGSMRYSELKDVRTSLKIEIDSICNSFKRAMNYGSGQLISDNDNKSNAALEAIGAEMQIEVISGRGVSEQKCRLQTFFNRLMKLLPHDLVSSIASEDGNDGGYAGLLDATLKDTFFAIETHATKAEGLHVCVLAFAAAALVAKERSQVLRSMLQAKSSPVRKQGKHIQHMMGVLKSSLDEDVRSAIAHFIALFLRDCNISHRGLAKKVVRNAAAFLQAGANSTAYLGAKCLFFELIRMMRLTKGGDMIEALLDTTMVQPLLDLPPVSSETNSEDLPLSDSIHYKNDTNSLNEKFDQMTISAKCALAVLIAVAPSFCLPSIQPKDRRPIRLLSKLILPVARILSLHRYYALEVESMRKLASDAFAALLSVPQLKEDALATFLLFSGIFSTRDETSEDDTSMPDKALGTLLAIQASMCILKSKDSNAAFASLCLVSVRPLLLCISNDRASDQVRGLATEIFSQLIPEVRVHLATTLKSPVTVEFVQRINGIIEALVNNPHEGISERAHRVPCIDILNECSHVESLFSTWHPTIPNESATCRVNLEVPTRRGVQLRQYQVAGVAWMMMMRDFGLGCLLCDDMGLGKTLQVLCAIASSKLKSIAPRNGSSSKNLYSLVVCPASVVSHWFHEVSRFFEPTVMKPITYLGTTSRRSVIRGALAASLQSDASSSKSVAHYVVVTSYGTFRNDFQLLHACVPRWMYMVLDEGHIIKNPTSQIFKAVKTFSSTVPHRVALSGTPVQNSILELWPLFHFLMPNLLGTRKSFEHFYLRPVKTLRAAGISSTRKMRESYIVAIEDLHLRLAPFIMRREKGEVLKDLPPKIVQDVRCTPSSEQRRLHDLFSQSNEGAKVRAHLDQYCSEGRSQGNRAGSRLPRMVGLQYLRMLCSHPCLVSSKLLKNTVQLEAETSSSRAPDSYLRRGADARKSGKMMALLRLFAEAGIGDGFNEKTTKGVSNASNLDIARFKPPASGWSHKFLIFAHFRRTLDLLESSVFRSHLRGVDYVRLDGKIASAKRGDIVTKFNTDPNLACMLLTTGVGGVGLNLSSADMVVFFEPDWNPMVDLQAMDRAHRIGQTRSVNVYRLITDDTLEEYMMDVQMFKTKLAKDVLSGIRGNDAANSTYGGEDFNSSSVSTSLGRSFAGNFVNQQQEHLSTSIEPAHHDEEYEKLHEVGAFIESLEK